MPEAPSFERRRDGKWVIMRANDMPEKHAPGDAMVLFDIRLGKHAVRWILTQYTSKSAHSDGLLPPATSWPDGIITRFRCESVCA
jgi:hypothetical protein